MFSGQGFSDFPTARQDTVNSLFQRPNGRPVGVANGMGTTPPPNSVLNPTLQGMQFASPVGAMPTPQPPAIAQPPAQPMMPNRMASGGDLQRQAANNALAKYGLR